MPPSIESLRDRLNARGTETAETLKVRVGNAQKELDTFAEKDTIFQFKIVNAELKTASEQFVKFIEALYKTELKC
jgi:guanylate kinase